MDKSELIEQTRLAFDFIQRLYLEASYLVKEVEGQLAEEEERFVIGRPIGYAVTTLRSVGLEPVYVNSWQIRKFGVMFVPQEMTKSERGQTSTPFEKNTVILYLRVVLDEKDLIEPYIYFGCLYSFERKREPNSWPDKVEQLLAHCELHETKIFPKANSLEYEDIAIKFQGNLFKVNLYDIKSSDDIQELLIKPALKLFREKVQKINL